MRQRRYLSDSLVISTFFLSWGIVAGANYSDLRIFGLSLFLLVGATHFFPQVVRPAIRIQILCFLGGFIYTAFHYETAKRSPPKWSSFQTFKVQKLDSENRVFEALILIPSSLRGRKLRIYAPEYVLAPQGAILELRDLRVSTEYRFGQWCNRGFAEEISPVLDLEGESVGVKIYYSFLQLRVFIQDKAREMTSGFPLVNQFLLEAILGVRGGQKSLKNSLKPLGLGHIFTISGFHLSLWGLISIFCLRKLTSNFKIQWTGYLLALFLYAFIVDFKPSVLRALVFGILLFSGSQLSRPVNSFRILALTLWIHFLIFPNDVLTPAFILTYGITFFLLLVAAYSKGDWRLNIVWLGILHILLCPYFLLLFGDFPVGSLLGILFSTILGLAIGVLMLALTLFMIIGSLQIFLSPVFKILEIGLESLTQLASYVDYKLVLTPSLPIEFLILFYFLLFIVCVIFYRKGRWVEPVDLQILNSVRDYCNRNLHLPRERFKKELLHGLRAKARSCGYQSQDDITLLTMIVQRWIVDLKVREFYSFICGPFVALWNLEMSRTKKRIEELKTLKGANILSVEKRLDRKSTRLNSSHSQQSRMPSSA